MFLVNPKSKQPLYEQLVDQLRRQLILGAVKAGAPMPSVRQLASELGINPNTIQKAYRCMEDEGMIESTWSQGEGKIAPKKMYSATDKGKQEAVRRFQVWKTFSHLPIIPEKSKQRGTAAPLCPQPRVAVITGKIENYVFN